MNFPTFMNSPLAWGALAFCVPLILHILNRSRFRQVEWGAMHLLESVVKVNHKKFRLEQLLLLLVRCSIPALLAFALAKPVLTGAKAPAGETPVSLVVLIDTSYSMQAGADKSNHFEEARQAACDVVNAAPRGSEISVIQTGGTPIPLFDRPVFDNKAVVRKLRTLEAAFGASDMQQALDLGIATLAGMTHARRELVVISDFQSADWHSTRNSQTANAIRQQIDGMEIKPELTLLQLGSPVSSNISIASLDFSRRPLGVGQQLFVRANIKNHGGSAPVDARVVLRIDGEEQSVSQVTLAAHAETQVLFPCEFDTPGSHLFDVEIVVDDPLQADNRLAAAVSVQDHIDVLLVDGELSSEPLKSETDFLSIALTPYAFGRMKLSDLIQTRTVKYSSNLKKEFAENPKVVVLANVARLTNAQANELCDYVESGGAVFVCAGRKIDTQWYNKMLFEQRNLLPAKFGVPKGMIDENGQSARIVAQHFDHPTLQFFNEPANGDLSAAEIRQWFELRMPAERLTSIAVMPVAQNLLTILFPSVAFSTSMIRTSADKVAADSSMPVVIARLDNGDPLLVEKSFGDGVVIQMATSVDADWSDLPLRPFYVPMMQQIVTTMATRLSPPRNIRTGETAVALLPVDPDQAIPETLRLSVTTPDGSQQIVLASPQKHTLMARFDGTNRPGVYSMFAPGSEPLHFVASTSREESNLTILDTTQLGTLADNMGAGVVESSAEYLEQDRLRRNGRDIWRYVLAAFLAFLILELVLQQRFSKVRT